MVLAPFSVPDMGSSPGFGSVSWSASKASGQAYWANPVAKRKDANPIARIPFNISGDQETHSKSGVINATNPHIAIPISARSWVRKRRSIALINVIMSFIFCTFPKIVTKKIPAASYQSYLSIFYPYFNGKCSYHIVLRNLVFIQYSCTG